MIHKLLKRIKNKVYFSMFRVRIQKDNCFGLAKRKCTFLIKSTNMSRFIFITVNYVFWNGIKKETFECIFPAAILDELAIATSPKVVILISQSRISGRNLSLLKLYVKLNHRTHLWTELKMSQHALDDVN